MSAILFAALVLTPKTPELSAWMVFWNPRSLVSFEKNAPKLSHVMPEWFGLNEEGIPVKRPAITSEQSERMFTIARRHDVKVYAMISNFADGGFDAKRAQAFLHDPVRLRRHIDSLVRQTVQAGFDGVDLDIESLAETDRDAFSAYVEALAKELRAANKALTVTLHPKESEPGTWDGPKAQDYARLGRVADRIKIMCYDFSWANSPLGPIAPDDWVERVMRFASSVIPKEKLDLGVAQYGYNWATNPATSLTYQDFAPNEGQSKECPRSGERIFEKTHFSGRNAFRRKLSLARQLELGGLSMWYLGSEDPGIWDAMNR